jgi:hypothetical protein
MTFFSFVGNLVFTILVFFNDKYQAMNDIATLYCTFKIFETKIENFKILNPSADH